MASHNPVVAEWAAKAESDWHLLSIIRGKDGTEDAVMFHAQQCAEKYLKAALIACQENPTKTHDISTLYRLLQVHRSDLDLDVSALDRLSQGGVSFRYPGCDATEEDAEFAIRQAGAIRAAIAPWLRSLPPST